MFYFYILKSSDATFYYGSTRDLRKRLKDHNSGKCFSTKSLKWHLIYYEAYFSEKDARLREKHIKAFGQSLTHLKKRLKYSLESN